MVSPIERQKMEAARKFGRVDKDGRVYVKVGTGKNAEEHQVGQYATGEIDETMELYVRRFVDQIEKMQLFAQRLESEVNITASDVDTNLAKFKAFTENYTAVGDFETVTKFIDGISLLGEQRKLLNKARHEAEVEDALKIFEGCISELEPYTFKDDTSVPWIQVQKLSNAAMERWKEAQKSARIPKKQADELWEKFAGIRSNLQTRSREFFKVERERSGTVKRKKDAIIAQAEEIKGSENFDATKRTFSRLMDQWKEAGRGNRKMDDEQWVKFRAIQDEFYSRIPKAEKPLKQDRPKWDNNLSSLNAPIAGLDALAALKSQLEGKKK